MNSYMPRLIWNDRRWTVLGLGSMVILLLGSWAFLPRRVTICVLALNACVMLMSVIMRILSDGRRGRQLKAQDFKVCINCEYLLHGLPPSGRCPECGVEYEVEELKRLWLSWLCGNTNRKNK